LGFTSRAYLDTERSARLRLSSQPTRRIRPGLPCLPGSAIVREVSGGRVSARMLAHALSVCTSRICVPVGRLRALSDAGPGPVFPETATRAGAAAARRGLPGESSAAAAAEPRSRRAAAAARALAAIAGPVAGQSAADNSPAVPTSRQPRGLEEDLHAPERTLEDAHQLRGAVRSPRECLGQSRSAGRSDLPLPRRADGRLHEKCQCGGQGARSALQ